MQVLLARNYPTWPETTQPGQKLPNLVRNCPIWSETAQSGQKLPNLVRNCPILVCHYATSHFTLLVMIDCMLWFYNVTNTCNWTLFLCFQKFVDQFSFFLGQDYFPTVSFCLSHCYFWVTVLHSFATSNSPYSCCFACAMIWLHHTFYHVL